MRNYDDIFQGKFNHAGLHANNKYYKKGCCYGREDEEIYIDIYSYNDGIF